MKVLAALFALLFATSAQAALYKASFDGIFDSVTDAKLSYALGETFSVAIYYESSETPDGPCRDNNWCMFSTVMFTLRSSSFAFETRIGTMSQSISSLYIGTNFSATAGLDFEPRGPVAISTGNRVPIGASITIRSLAGNTIGLDSSHQLQTSPLNISGATLALLTLHLGRPVYDGDGNLFAENGYGMIQSRQITAHDIVQVDGLPDFRADLTTFKEASRMQPVPVPASLPFLLAGLGGLMLLRRLN